MQMKLLFCGDVCFTNHTVSPEQAGVILRDVLPVAQRADFVIANCETVLADRTTVEPIAKSGPNLVDRPENICFFEALGTDVAVLANNHIGDFGEKGTMDTIALLQEHHIRTVGAGANLENAYKACHLEKNGIQISILAVCENEFGMATKTTAGTAGLKLGLLHNRIREEKQQGGYCIVVCHGGNEFNPVPSPKVMERYRLFCDMGADAVVAMHTHCPQGYEWYGGKPIIYSLGNFFFTPRQGVKKTSDNSWFYGYMAELSIENGVMTMCPIPYRFDPMGSKITVFAQEERDKMMAYLEKLSAVLENEDAVANYFTGWTYRYPWSPVQITDLTACLENDYPYTGEFNLLSCEAHNEKLTEAYRIMMKRDVEKARYWAEKSIELEKMPV